MTLVDFVKQLVKDAAAFEGHIEQLNKEYPEAAATDIGEADWFEQFCMYVESLER